MCEHCRNIQTWRKFDAPKDYLACIAYIQQLVFAASPGVDHTGEDLAAVLAPDHVGHDFIRPAILCLYLLQ